MKRSILIVDDMDINREILAESFMGDYNIIEAENGIEALSYIENNIHDIAAVLLDLIMPEMDGMSVLKKMNENGSIIHIPVFIITAEENESILMEAYNLGAVDVITKPFMMTFIKCRIENIIELYSHRNDLEAVVNEQVRKLSKFNQSMVEALATLVEFRDCESGEHIKRMSGFTNILMNKVSSMYPEYRLPKAEIDKIVSASVLHDVGKIAVPDSILNKPGKLTPEEFEIMKSHSIKGSEIIQRVLYIIDDNVYNYSYDIARHHHERWDGMGYPDNLAGDKITIWSQVVSIVDVYDALISPRVYKNAFDHDTAMRMIMNGECGAFNPKVLKAFELCVDSIKQKHMEFLDKKVKRNVCSKRLLIVDDSEIDRSLLKNMLESDFKITEAPNGFEALKILKDKEHEKIDGVLLDIAMPIIDGFNVLKIIREDGSLVPVIVMSSEATKENVEKCVQYNISGFFRKPFNPGTVIDKLHEIFNISEENPDEPLETPSMLIEDDINSTMMYASHLTSIYNSYLENCNKDDLEYKRVADIVNILLEEYAVQRKKPELDTIHRNIISRAAYFYDIGRMVLSDDVVRNHHSVDEHGFIYMDHTKAGADIVRLNKDKSCRFFVKVCADICMHHHERYDGEGYPQRLKGDEISDYTHLCSLAIEFNKIFSKRKEYNDRQFDFTVKEIEVDYGKFNPQFIHILNCCHSAIIRYYKHKTKDKVTS